ncbi:hypothetical protein BU23DRAFT_220892 [Bimuria novae-zelandiae CBS 107.79]|uniref:Uncharacterized protein n=1 Tax=Bimuria novae-zelandiae CBS 107.79 TaxID=1447943 RepID=A0A6A5V082_9PLEO|nr:hypothetical protein BU23DRAFT_220892 [Bimuria novae-zelandiae CBS 107.79]
MARCHHAVTRRRRAPQSALPLPRPQIALKCDVDQILSDHDIKIDKIIMYFRRYRSNWNFTVATVVCRTLEMQQAALQLHEIPLFRYTIKITAWDGRAIRKRPYFPDLNNGWYPSETADVWNIKPKEYLASHGQNLHDIYHESRGRNTSSTMEGEIVIALKGPT